MNFIKENEKEKIIAFEIPLLYETGANEWLDYIISVFCSEKISCLPTTVKACNEAKWKSMLSSAGSGIEDNPVSCPSRLLYFFQGCPRFHCNPTLTVLFEFNHCFKYSEKI